MSLFQRVVLMSGSSFSPWAEVRDAFSVTVRLAKLLNCSLPEHLHHSHPQTVACLRNVSASTLASVSLPEYKFASTFGPSVDGVVVPEDFNARWNAALQDRQLQIMMGVTEADSFPELTARQEDEGMEVEERNRVLRTFVRNTYDHHLQEIYLTIAKEYTDWSNPVQHPMGLRDLIVEALSDGSYVAPLSRLGHAIAPHVHNAYMYVFSHQSSPREDLRVGAVWGSELPMAFGAPWWVDGSPMGYRRDNYTKSDMSVSQLFMKYLANFARSGDPNIADNDPTPVLADRIKTRKAFWEPYDTLYEKYLDINTRPRLKDHYRAHKMALWNWLIPELQSAGSKYAEPEEDAWHSVEDETFFLGPVRPLDPFRFLNASMDIIGTTDSTALLSPVDDFLAPNVSAAQGGVSVHPTNESLAAPSTSSSSSSSSLGPFDYTTALSLTVAIGLSLLVLNIIVFAAVVYKRERPSMGPKLKFESSSDQPLCSMETSLRSGSTHETLVTPCKDTQAICNIDMQCTELQAPSNLPDIGDRNTDVTFNSSYHTMCTASRYPSGVPPPPGTDTQAVGYGGEAAPCMTGEPGQCNTISYYPETVLDPCRQYVEGGIRQISETEHCSETGGSSSYPTARHCQERSPTLYGKLDQCCEGSQAVPLLAQYTMASPVSREGYHTESSPRESYRTDTTSSYHPEPQARDTYHPDASQRESYSISPDPTTMVPISHYPVRRNSAHFPATQFYVTPPEDSPKSAATQQLSTATLKRTSSTSKPPIPPRTSTLPAYATLPRNAPNSSSTGSSGKDTIAHITA
ncbi:neuroligin-3-like [Oratosquilla oratoria]|uniref:neuroligin-3-like n=1 Tax=Oratosquilla oratoria TaxID=337810 RepID=UPI003F77715D